MITSKIISTLQTHHNPLAFQTLDRFLGAASQYFINSQESGNPDQLIEHGQNSLLQLTEMPLNTSLANVFREHNHALARIVHTLKMNPDETFLIRLISEIEDAGDLALSNNQAVFLSLGLSILKEMMFSNVTALNSWTQMFRLFDDNTEISNRDLFAISTLYQKLTMLNCELEKKDEPTINKIRQTISLYLDSFARKIKQFVSEIADVPPNYLSQMMTQENASIWDKYLNIETIEQEADSKTMGSPFLRENNPYEGAAYRDIAKLMRFIDFAPDDIVVDYGCGKGRFLSVIGSFTPVRKVIGLDLEKSYVDQAQENLMSTKHLKSDFSVYQMNAADFVPEEETVFFFFNPFSGYTFKKVIYNIKTSLKKTPRSIKIAYLCPIEQRVLDAQNWLIKEPDLDQGRILVWKNR